MLEREPFIAILEISLDYGIKDGVFRRFNIMNQAYILEGIIAGFISQWLTDKRKGALADKAGVVAETFWYGIVSDEQKEREGNKRRYQITQYPKNLQGRVS